jgi:phage regulator Rha-like protein
MAYRRGKEAAGGGSMSAQREDGPDATHDQPAKTLTKRTADFTLAESDLTLTTTSTEARIDSRLMARGFGNKHKAVMALIDRYADRLKELGILPFKKEVIKGRGQPEGYALMNEDQAYLLLSLSRNTEVVVGLKVKLVKAFGEARRAAEMRRTEYLPVYHALHDQIKVLAAGSSNERFTHMNINKRLNKLAGIEAGQRAGAPVTKQGILIAGQILMAAAIQAAKDNKDMYRLAVQALQPLENALLALEGE